MVKILKDLETDSKDSRYTLIQIPTNFLISAICPYNHLGKRSASKKECHYLSVADDTGVLRLMLLPKHLHASTEQAVN